MNYELKAETGFLKLEALTPEQRIAAAEREIAAALEKNGCILIVQVAAKAPDEEQPK
jgi:hypothetical protein